MKTKLNMQRTRSEVLNEINTLSRAVEEHNIARLNNLEHTMIVSIPKQQLHITDLYIFTCCKVYSMLFIKCLKNLNIKIIINKINKK